ncbi:MAG: polymer-forming cytoskeletal protein [Inquilinus sp.]|nr:polymer-forming cytoskeletal protein [Inquilinus sp.]
MFKKDDKAPGAGSTTGGFGGSDNAQSETHRPAARGGSGEHSVISAGLRVIGNLESDEDVEVRGIVEGDISSRTLTVSEGARVEGAIAADRVTVAGTVNGKISADRVAISKSGSMIGDLTYKSLSIEEGASFDGQCRRSDAGRREPEKVSNLKPVQTEAAQVAPKDEPTAAAAGAKGGKSAAAS